MAALKGRRVKMRGRINLIGMGVVAIICIGILFIVPSISGAHCDTLDGPVVMTAKKALDKGDVTPAPRCHG
jgi:hypothetical protein